jgi:chromosome segregation ATPase
LTPLAWHDLPRDRKAELNKMTAEELTRTIKEEAMKRTTRTPSSWGPEFDAPDPATPAAIQSNAKLESEIAILRRALSDSRERAENAERDLEEAREAHAEKLAGAIKAAKTERSDANDELRSELEETKARAAKIKSADALIESLTAELVEARSGIDAAYARIAALKAAAGSLQSDLDAAYARITGLKAANAELRAWLARSPA